MRCTTVLRQQPPAGGCPPPGPAPRGSGPPRATRRSPTTPRKVWRPTGTRGGPSPMGVRCFLWPGSQWVGGGASQPGHVRECPPHRTGGSCVSMCFEKRTFRVQLCLRTQTLEDMPAEVLTHRRPPSWACKRKQCMPLSLKS